MSKLTFILWRSLSQLVRFWCCWKKSCSSPSGDRVLDCSIFFIFLNLWFIVECGMEAIIWKSTCLPQFDSNPMISIGNCNQDFALFVIESRCNSVRVCMWGRKENLFNGQRGSWIDWVYRMLSIGNGYVALVEYHLIRTVSIQTAFAPSLSMEDDGQWHDPLLITDVSWQNEQNSHSHCKIITIHPPTHCNS